MFATISDIKAANRRVGQLWFDPATMAFFGSQILPEVYHGAYFISSEQYVPTATAKDKGAQDGPRQFTIHKVDERGWVDTVGEFQQYNTAQDAITAVLGME
jgi:hypothetical protein